MHLKSLAFRGTVPAGMTVSWQYNRLMVQIDGEVMTDATTGEILYCRDGYYAPVLVPVESSQTALESPMLADSDIRRMIGPDDGNGGSKVTLPPNGPLPNVGPGYARRLPSILRP